MDTTLLKQTANENWAEILAGGAVPPVPKGWKSLKMMREEILKKNGVCIGIDKLREKVNAGLGVDWEAKMWPVPGTTKKSWARIYRRIK